MAVGNCFGAQQLLKGMVNWVYTLLNPVGSSRSRCVSSTECTVSSSVQTCVLEGRPSGNQTIPFFIVLRLQNMSLFTGHNELTFLTGITVVNVVFAQMAPQWIPNSYLWETFDGKMISWCDGVRSSGTFGCHALSLSGRLALLLSSGLQGVKLVQDSPAFHLVYRPGVATCGVGSGAKQLFDMELYSKCVRRVIGCSSF